MTINSEKRMAVKFNEKLRNAIDIGAKEAQKLSKGLEDNPAYALDWADSAYKAIGAQFAATILQSVLTSGGIIAAKEYALKMVLLASRNPSQSTSACRNLLEQSKLAGFAEFAEWICDRTKLEEDME